MTPSISVLIATYNRAHRLDECLTHLRRQPFAPRDEIIVADNASSDGTASVVAAHQRQDGPPVRYVHVAQPGKSIALQSALSSATGDVLAFIDDDVLVEPGWLDAVRRAMRDETTMLAGGPVIPRWERPAPRWLSIGAGPFGRLASPIALLHYGPDPSDLGARTLLGANMAVRRDALDAVGGFATHLGKLRGTLLSGEDADLCARIHVRGWNARYVPDAIVRHWVPTARMRVGYYGAWFFWSGITHAVMDGAPRRHVLGLPPWLLRRAAGLPGVALRALVPSASPGGLIEALADLSFVVGYAAGRWRLVRAGIPSPSALDRPTCAPAQSQS